MTSEPKPPTWPEPTAPHHEDTPTPLHEDTSACLTEAERAAERAAFAELVAFIKANKETGTEVTHLTVDEYANTLE